MAASGNQPAASIQFKLDADAESMKRAAAEAEVAMAELEKAIRASGKQMDELAERSNLSSKALQRHHEEMSARILELTGTETERRLAAVDQRHAAFLAKARKAGEDTYALEVAIHQRKHEILMEAEMNALHTAALADEQLLQQEKAAAAKLITEAEKVAKQETLLKEKAAAEALAIRAKQSKAEMDAMFVTVKSQGEIRGAIDKSKMQVKGLSDAIRAAGFSSGQFSGALQTLRTVGVSPLTIGLAAVVLVMKKVTDAIREGEKANREYLDSVARMRGEVAELRNTLAEKKGIIPEAAVANDLRKLQEMETAWQRLNEKAMALESAALSSANKVNPFAESLADAQKAAALALAELTALREKLRLKKEIKDVDAGNAAEVAAQEQINQKHQEFLVLLEQERQQDRDMAIERTAYLAQLDEELSTLSRLSSAKTDYARDEVQIQIEQEKSIAQLIRLGMTQEEAIASTKALTDAKLELLDAAEEARRAEEIVAIHEQMEAALLDLTGTATEKQLAAFDKRYAELLAQAQAHGLDITALTRAIEEERAKIIEASTEQAARSVDVVTERVERSSEATGRLRDRWDGVTVAIEATAEALAAFNSAEAQLMRQLKVNDGRGLFSDYITPASGAFLGPSNLSSTAGFTDAPRTPATVKINVKATNTEIGNASASVAADGSVEVDLDAESVVAGSILSDGPVAMAIEKRYGFSPRAANR